MDQSGATAARGVLCPGVKVTQERGRVEPRQTPVEERPVLVRVHPSAVLRTRGDEHQLAYAVPVDDLRTVAEAVA